MSALKQFVKKQFLSYGYEIKKVNPEFVGCKDFWIWLRETHNFNTLIDIGANDGDFGGFIANYFNVETVYSIEPLEIYNAQIRNNLKNIENVHIFNLALSDKKSSARFNINDYGPSSSLLHVSDIHVREFPKTGNENETSVEIECLDDLLGKMDLKDQIVIKIDVQGVEDKVITGGMEIFKKADAVLIEMSFVEMYETQPLFEEVHDLLKKAGFRFKGMKNQIDSKETGEPLFGHCLYVKG